MTGQSYFHPIMTCEQAVAFEGRLLSRRDNQWTAMQTAGRALGSAILNDVCECLPLPSAPRILLLVGKGHNGGDALLAGAEIARRLPNATIYYYPLTSKKDWRSLTLDALKELSDVTEPLEINWPTALRYPFDIAIDGMLGMQFKPPLNTATAELFRQINAHTRITMRAAVDLPSALGEPDALRADFTYATGILKRPVLAPDMGSWVGRLRYLDLNFFTLASDDDELQLLRDKVAGPCLLDRWRQPRRVDVDKRHFGHTFVLSGSRQMPGALLMSVRAALQSGAGLVTAFAPQSITAQLAAQVPEAMWVPWPETPEGTLALEGRHLLHEQLAKATSLVCGSGIGEVPETLTMVRELLAHVPVPIVLDADALRPEVVAGLQARADTLPKIILTPHVGEFRRISEADVSSVHDDALCGFAARQKCIVVLKEPLTRITDGSELVYDCNGGPVLARGGSGDLLAGVIGSVLAQNDAARHRGSHPLNELECAVAGVMWLRKAADKLAQAHGHAGVRTTQVLDFMSAALRED